MHAGGCPRPGQDAPRLQPGTDPLICGFKRIQFTPDLMPSDITGTEVIYRDPDHRRAPVQIPAGPIFANVILADEIDRTPPKTQAAMLEAMPTR